MFPSDENYLFAVFCAFLGLLRGKVHSSACSAGYGINTLNDKGFAQFLDLRNIDSRIENAFNVACLYARDGLLFCDEFFLDQVNGDFERGTGGALSRSALQHVHFFFLDREFEVLHVLVMLFKG